MHQRTHLDLQGSLSPRTTQDGASFWSSRLKMGSRRGSRLVGTPVWAWLLLGALLVPGARSFLTEEQQELLVDLHNHYRGQVSPRAAAMLPLKWDPTLKVVAEGYAAKCIWNHNPELVETGENLHASTGPLDLSGALEKWFLERLDYHYHNNSCEDEKMCGHYTQMVWADTHRVGCAIHHCNTMEGLDWERVIFLVCNYYPAGNFEDEQPYVEGESCSGCPENFENCQNNLCVPDTGEEGEVDTEDDGEVGETTDPTLQPPEAASTETNPSVQETTAIPPDVITERSEDSPPPVTAVDVDVTSARGASSATLGQEEKEEDEEKEEAREIHKEEREGKLRKESTKREEEETWEIKIGVEKVPASTVSAGSVSESSGLLAVLTGTLLLCL